MQYMQLAIALMGEEKASKLSQQQLELLAKQYADMSGIPLPELEKITAEQLGPSNVGGMQSDQGLRSKQMTALAEIQNIIDSGGLDLTDKAGLEEAMNAATNQQHRARAGVAADAAERGQMNSGNRLVMDMDAAQQGANAARKTGLETAGMAQRRRLQAIQDSSSMAGGLREQDWREKEAAERATDIRDERNAASREKAQYHNAGIPQQQFANDVARKGGAVPAANAYAGGLAAAATDARASAAGISNVMGAYGGVQDNGGTNPNSGGGYNYYEDLTGQRGGVTDLAKDENDK